MLPAVNELQETTPVAACTGNDWPTSVEQKLAARPVQVPGLLALSILSLVLLWAYGSTLATMAERWAHDPLYSHGYFVPVFALLILWFRRGQVTAEFRPSGWGIPLLGIALLLRLTGAYFYFEWLDALSLLPSLAGLVVLLMGVAGWRWAWPAILFLGFMLPLPYQLEVGLAHPLQRVATVASTYALQTLGLPALSEGNIIVIEEERIGVVEACSGLGMLFTFFALSTAFAIVCERPWLDKLVIFLSAIPIGVFANGLRITVTAVLHRTVASEQANVVFHDLAGWLMMPLALGMLWLELHLLAHLFLPVQPSCPRTSCPLPSVKGEGIGPLATLIVRQRGDTTHATK